MKFICCFLTLICFLTAAEYPSGVMNLWPGDAPGAKGKDKNKDIPTLKPYWPANRQAGMPAILLAPGGGYKHLSSIGPFAKELMQLGFAVFYLRYRLPVNGYQQPYPLRDAQRAMSLIRSNAKKWGLDVNKIGVLGFSSGGHVATSLSNHFKLDNSLIKDEVDKVSCRPDFTVLFCPVVTMKEHAHKPSVVRLLGKSPVKELVDYYSNEEQVTKETPPAFMAHAADDFLVKVENSQKYDAALKKAGIKSSLHIYKEKCGHGIPSKVDFWRGPLKVFLKEIQVIK
jgi:acetyl esterase/lipase